MSINDITGVTASAPVPGVTSRAASISYYSSVLSELPGRYEGTEKSYDGLTWAQLYNKLASQNTSADPLTLANTVLGIAAAQGVSVNDVQSVVNATSSTATSIAQGTQAAANQNFGLPSVSNPLDYLENIADFFTRLTQAATWERVGEVVVGVIVLYVGIKAIATPAGQSPAKKTFRDTVKHVTEAAIAAPK